jgi:hypothetical protein
MGNSEIAIAYLIYRVYQYFSIVKTTKGYSLELCGCVVKNEIGIDNAKHPHCTQVTHIHCNEKVISWVCHFSISAFRRVDLNPRSPLITHQ